MRDQLLSCAAPRGDGAAVLADRIWIAKGIMKELAAETPWQIIRPCVYVPNAQVPDALKALKVRITPIAWVVRTRGEPRALSAAVQEQLRQVSGLAVAGVRTMDEVISRSTSSG